MIKFYKILFLFIAIGFYSQSVSGQNKQTNMSFVVSMENAVNHYYHVVLTYNNVKKDNLELNMCAWTPGYYEILDYAKAVENFHAKDQAGNEIHYDRPSKNTWMIHNHNVKTLTVTYDLKAVISFVGDVYLDENRGYITPGGLFMYANDELKHPVTVQFKPYSKWSNLVATGLDSIPGKNNTFYADNFDVLYDSPFLMGKLETLPLFTIQGIPHNFIGYDPGQFDRNAFMADLKKVVAAGIDVIKDIPYTHYTFLAIGQGGGGIEHLNSTSVSLKNKDFLLTNDGKKRFYTFLAHEYFHHYNVKRIRPIELGPFDYTKENYTNMLWVSEGITEYYANLMVKHAGVITTEDLFKAFQTKISAYENKPGHLYQSATQASHDTWTEFPFGKNDEELNKTISYYDKGSALGLMLDFAIRHQTKNVKSLDDLMRLLYKKYYQNLKRGFTEKEFQAECEKMAGTPLTEIFEYASTVKPVNYPKYFAYGGLEIDTTTASLPGTYLGIGTTKRDTGLVISLVEWNSPAWLAGLRANSKILQIDDAAPSLELLNNAIKSKNVGDDIKLKVIKNGQPKEFLIKFGRKREKSFAIKPMPNPDALQAAILKSWLKE